MTNKTDVYIKPINGRIAHRLRLKHTRRGPVIQEGRGDAWLQLLAVVLICLAIAGVFYFALRNEPDALLISGIISAAFAAILVPIVLLGNVPWNRRIRLNTTTQTYELTYRYFILPYKTVRFDALKYCLNAETVNHQTEKSSGTANAAGCLLMLFGPIGSLAALFLSKEDKKISFTPMPTITAIPLHTLDTSEVNETAIALFCCKRESDALATVEAMDGELLCVM